MSTAAAPPPAEPPRPDRRTAIAWMLAAAATGALLPGRLRSAAPDPNVPVPAAGYGRDPDLTRTYKPGDVWPLTLTGAQRRTAAALCAVILPADERSPSAADLKVHDFIDEWISAPYPSHEHDRRVILDGLAWMDDEARRRFGQPFAAAGATGQRAICDAICRPAAAALAAPAAFFRRYSELTAGGFYSTPEGMRDIGYVGNVPLPSFDGPPHDLLARLGLA